jgi:hypothetical protein
LHFYFLLKPEAKKKICGKGEREEGRVGCDKIQEWDFSKFDSFFVVVGCFRLKSDFFKTINKK